MKSLFCYALAVTSSFFLSRHIYQTAIHYFSIPTKWFQSHLTQNYALVHAHPFTISESIYVHKRPRAETMGKSSKAASHLTACAYRAEHRSPITMPNGSQGDRINASYQPAEQPRSNISACRTTTVRHISLPKDGQTPRLTTSATHYLHYFVTSSRFP
jgi:hypothetical protein